MPNKNYPRDVWKKINKKGEDECWEWMGYIRKDGYAQLKIQQKMYLAHRVVFGLINGSIPNNLLVLHTCDNRRCCNPKHLYIGTQQNNMDDMFKKNRNVSLVGIKNGRCKLKENDVKIIRQLYVSGKYNKRRLSKIYNVTPSTIGDIISKKLWKHL